MRNKILFIVLLFSSITIYGQRTDENFVFWSATRKLTLSDFGIKTANGETNSSFAQFSVDYRVGGFDFMTKNFNKKVRNYMIKSASWIDTTKNTTILLQYQQILFDICEIYTRHFRKELKENRKKIAFGNQFVTELNQKAMTEFSNRRVLYDKLTDFGKIPEKQKEWEVQIKKELNELKEFESE